MLSGQQQEVVLGLAYLPGRPPVTTSAGLLACFNATDGVQLGVGLVEAAVQDQSPDDLELALMVCNHFGFGPGHLPLLLELADAAWHRSHEDIVEYLGEFRGDDVVQALEHATEWIPTYLDFDDARALGRKAVFELDKQRTASADDALRRVALSGTPILADEAQRLLSDCQAAPKRSRLFGTFRRGV